MKVGRLTNRRRVFIEEYLECGFNATEAARRAGYKHPNVKGSQLVKVSAIAEKIAQRIKEKSMTADEVLLRLAEQARGDISKFLTSTGAIDWDAVRAKGHLVKSITHTKGNRSRIDIHDAQSALALLGKHLRLFIERRELSGAEGGPIEHKDVTELTDEERTRRILALLGASEGEGTGSPVADQPGVSEDIPE